MRLSCPRRRLLPLLSCLGLALASQAPVLAASAAPKLLWQTPADLYRPESVLLDAKRNVIFVSSMADMKKDGRRGFISKVSRDGRIIERLWVKDLDSPKGLGFFGNTLYVTDVDTLVGIDMDSGKVTLRQTFAGARQLNDIAVAKDGTLYITDEINPGRIYRWKAGQVDIVIELPDTMKSLNGIKMDGDTLLFGTRAGLATLDPITKLIDFITGPSGFIDGLTPSGKAGLYLITDNAGKIQLVGKGRANEVIQDTTASKQSAADIDYVPDQQLLLVPDMQGNRLSAYAWSAEGEG